MKIIVHALSPFYSAYLGARLVLIYCRLTARNAYILILRVRLARKEYRVAALRARLNG